MLLVAVLSDLKINDKYTMTNAQQMKNEIIV